MNPKESGVRYEVFTDISQSTDLGKLAPELIACIFRFFEKRIFDGDIEHLFSCSLLVVAFAEDETPVGLAILRRFYKFEEDEAICSSLSVGGVIPEFQNRGIYSELNRIRLAFALLEKTELLSFDTQNPVIEKVICKILEEFKKIGWIDSYTFNRTKVIGGFSEQLGKQLPSSEGTPYEELNIKNGDSFTVHFHLNYKA